MSLFKGRNDSEWLGGDSEDDVLESMGDGAQDHAEVRVTKGQRLGDYEGKEGHCGHGAGHQGGQWEVKVMVWRNRREWGDTCMSWAQAKLTLLLVPQAKLGMFQLTGL